MRRGPPNERSHKIYATGNGATKDPVEAEKWFIQAAENNLLAAQYTLASNYAQGTGVEKNEAKAFEWYRKAAEGGLIIAQRDLGGLYLTDFGGKPDHEQALKWSKRAAENGDFGAPGLALSKLILPCL